MRALKSTKKSCSTPDRLAQVQALVKSFPTRDPDRILDASRPFGRVDWRFDGSVDSAVFAVRKCRAPPGGHLYSLTMGKKRPTERVGSVSQDAAARKPARAGSLSPVDSAFEPTVQALVVFAFCVHEKQYCRYRLFWIHFCGKVR